MPEPVGATTSACEPEEIAFQAPFWAGVGAEKAPRNQSRVGRLNRSMASAASVPPASSCPFIPPSCPNAPTGNGGPQSGRYHGSREVTLAPMTRAGMGGKSHLGGSEATGPGRRRWSAAWCPALLQASGAGRRTARRCPRAGRRGSRPAGVTRAVRVVGGLGVAQRGGAGLARGEQDVGGGGGLVPGRGRADRGAVGVGGEGNAGKALQQAGLGAGVRQDQLSCRRCRPRRRRWNRWWPSARRPCTARDRQARTTGAGEAAADAAGAGGCGGGGGGGGGLALELAGEDAGVLDVWDCAVPAPQPARKSAAAAAAVVNASLVLIR